MAVGGDEQEVLEPHAALAAAVGARLDGEDVAGREPAGAARRPIRGRHHPHLQQADRVAAEPAVFARGAGEPVPERELVPA